MSRRQKREAARLAAVIVRDYGDDEQAIARFLLPVVKRGDLGDVMARELRANGRMRVKAIRKAASPPVPPPGFVSLDPGRFVTRLGPPPAVKPVNGSSGHDHTFDPSLWRADQ